MAIPNYFVMGLLRMKIVRAVGKMYVLWMKMSLLGDPGMLAAVYR